MSDSTQTGYRVLARKYRPEKFSELIGQDALVRTLGNALTLGRLAHAFVLTGVRGVGKTSTARLLARGLNCIGADGAGEPTLEPCGACEPCQAIAAGRHVDVLEIDAASHTGVDDAREIIEGVSYRPVSARYKIYIIDEVHMMSKSAFNALLKTLEEPPDQVKFIFATTEIRKVPVTILSRCQRFDLRRVDVDVLATHLQSICERESIAAEAEAITAIARAAEGSVRDSLSLLDQAAAMTGDTLTADTIADMLGRPGRQHSIAMLQAALAGDAAGALATLTEAHANGAEPEMAIADLLDLVHRASMQAAGGSSDTLLEAEKEPVAKLAEMGIAKLGRAWQMLLKGHAEITMAPLPMAAAEMLLIRLAHLASMPTPADIISRLGSGEDAAQPAPAKTPTNGGGTSTGTADNPDAADAAISDAPMNDASAAPSIDAISPNGSSAASPADAAPSTPPPSSHAPDGHNREPARGASSVMTAQAPQMNTQPAAELAPETMPSTDAGIGDIASLHDIAILADAKDEALLAARIRNFARPVRLQPGMIEICLAEGAPENLAGDMARFLSQTSGTRWMVSIAESGGGMTLAEERNAAREAQKATLAETPLVKAIMDTFPGTTIEDVRPVSSPPIEMPDEDPEQ